jgi:hypothetical protein
MLASADFYTHEQPDHPQEKPERQEEQDGRNRPRLEQILEVSTL